MTFIRLVGPDPNGLFYSYDFRKEDRVACPMVFGTLSTENAGDAVADA